MDFNIADLLESAQKKGKLDCWTRYQSVDPKEIRKELEGISNPRQQLKYLSQMYPTPFVFILIQLGKMT